MSSTEPGPLLDAVIEHGTREDFTAWVASGRAGLLVLREELAGGHPRESRVHPKDAIDGLTAAAAAIAEEHPDAFLEVFSDPRFDEDGFVLAGLGRIDDERATERLANAAKARSEWTRMDAAIGLGWRPADLAVRTLLTLLDDPQYLVRYHTLRSLAAIGDAQALGALRDFLSAAASFERGLAEDAILQIERRVSPRGERQNSQTVGPRDIGAR